MCNSFSVSYLKAPQTDRMPPTGGHTELLAAAAESLDHRALDQQRKWRRAFFRADNQRPVGRVREGFGAHHRVFTVFEFKNQKP